MTPTQTDPPFVPLRHSGWATRRTPLWVFGALAVIVVGVVLVSLAYNPSQSQRASDLTGYFGDVKAGIGSCSAGLRDSENAYGQVLAGDTSHLKTAQAILTYGAQNCGVANNQALTDFASYQVSESLASFNLDKADQDVITWSFDSTTVQQDMLTVLAAPGAARTADNAAVRAAQARLHVQAAAVEAIWSAARKSTGAAAPLPSLQP